MQKGRSEWEFAAYYILCLRSYLTSPSCPIWHLLLLGSFAARMIPLTRNRKPTIDNQNLAGNIGGF